MKAYQNILRIALICSISAASTLATAQSFSVLNPMHSDQAQSHLEGDLEYLNQKIDNGSVSSSDRMDRSMILLQLGFFEMARIDLEILRHSSTVATDSVLFLNGFCAYMMGDFQRAESLLRASLKSNPQLIAAHATLAQNYIAQGRDDSASAHLGAVISAGYELPAHLLPFLQPMDSEAFVPEEIPYSNDLLYTDLGD